MLTAVWFCISPCRNGWSGWQAGEKLLCDLNPPSALGALALLIPVLLMPAMEASLPGALVVPALCSWLWMICFGCFPTEKNLLWEYDKGQDLLLGHVHVHLFLQGKGDFLDITGGLGDLQSLCSYLFSSFYPWSVIGALLLCMHMCFLSGCCDRKVPVWRVRSLLSDCVWNSALAMEK